MAEIPYFAMKEWWEQEESPREQDSEGEVFDILGEEDEDDAED